MYWSQSQTASLWSTESQPLHCIPCPDWEDCPHHHVYHQILTRNFRSQDSQMNSYNRVIADRSVVSELLPEPCKDPRGSEWHRASAALPFLLF